MYLKTCYSCNIEKEIDLFYKHKYMSDGHLNLCIECQKERSRINHDINRESRNNSRRHRYVKNKEHHKSVCTRNKKEARKKSGILRLKDALGHSIYMACKKRGFTKRSKMALFIGCDWDYFKAYIESMFVDGMNWDNYGEWHIDHITPLCSAKTEDEVYFLNHYKNLRPLWAIDNLKKGGRMI